MSFFRREARVANLAGVLLAERTAQRNGTFNSVSNETARRASTVWACARLHADLISTFPVDVYRRTRQGRVEIDPPMWLTQPQPGMDLIQWLDAVVMSLEFDGNVFGVVTPGEDGWPVAVSLLDPDAVTVRRGDDGLADYVYERQILPRPLVWHIKGPCWPGQLRGMSPVGYARLSIGVAVAGRQYVERFFTDGGHPTVEVIVDDPNLTQFQAADIKGNVVTVLNGSREPWVHGSGITTKTWQLSPADTDFLDVMGATDLDICRFMSVRQPELALVTMQGSSLTYQNLEQRGTALLQFTTNPVTRRVEQALSKLTPRGQYVKFNQDAIQRPDAVTRSKIEDIRLRNGTWSQNDVRRLEDESPIINGDQYVWPPGNRTGSDGGTNGST